MAAKKQNARDLFNKQNTEAEVAGFEEASSQVNDFGARIKLNKGMNILWPLPAIGTMTSFVAPKKIHYSPMHVCGRVGKYVHPISGKTVDDRDFSKCFRCTGASDAWKADGHGGKGNKSSKDPQKGKFKDDMPNDAGLIQAVDFTPFFMMKGRNPVFNQKLAEHLEDFIAAVGGDGEALERLPNEELKAAAEAGICQVIVNDSLKNSLVETERTCRDTFELRAENGDESLAAYVEDGLPLHPEAFLVYIDRGEDKSKPFTGRDGKERYPALYTVTYLTSDHLVGKAKTAWSNALPADALWECAAQSATDLSNPRAALEDDADVKTLATNFVTLTHSEISEYLKSTGHSFTPITATAGDTADGGGSTEEASGIEMSDPDSFDTEGASEVMADASAKDAIAAARALIKQSQASEEASAE